MDIVAGDNAPHAVWEDNNPLQIAMSQAIVDSIIDNFPEGIKAYPSIGNHGMWRHRYLQWHLRIGSSLNPLAGKFSEDTREKGKGANTGASHDWRSFYLSQYDWLKGSHMTKVVWLLNETDYSYCEFVAPNTPC